MVKCPRGTPSQIRANLNRQRGSVRNSLLSWVQEQTFQVEENEVTPESDESELDSIQADKRNPPTARDELVYVFINCFLDVLLKSWEGKPCYKTKLGKFLITSNESEEFGEDLGPCEPSIVSSTADFLKDLYQKRALNLSKEILKNESESTESEFMHEEDYEPPPPSSLPGVTPDEDVHFVFINGVWYKGRVSRKLMDGLGYYFWEDGTSYEGEFEEGYVTGKGCLQFPDLSVYEGGVYRAFRHGEGMFCFSDSSVMYTGQWWLGKKHGQGLIVYNDPSESHNYYRGQWEGGFKEGFGFRQYPSGAKYVGFWSKGKRHGRGAMFWSNHDIYRGDWKEGLMHGYGEYTWNGFVNKSLSYPATNTYRGSWAEGKRNGPGLFELKSGSLIETSWMENMKEGLGAVICENGFVVASENLFMKDKPAIDRLPQSELKSLTSKLQLKKHREVPVVEKDSAKKSKNISIPIHSPVHTLDLYPHVQKYFIQKKENILKCLAESELELYFAKLNPQLKHNGEEVKFEKSEFELSQTELCQLAECSLREEKYLRNCIINKISALRSCYDYYAKLACETPPAFKCVLLRMFLWQMLIDGGVPNCNLSLVDVDCILACENYLLIENPHDPFERILFWQFIHSLIALSWHFYGRFVSGELPLAAEERIVKFLQYYDNCECKSVLKTAFEYFIEVDVFCGRFREGFTPPPTQVNMFEESDFAPMEAMYIIYCSVGVPHTARDFVNAVCRKESENDWKPFIVRYFEKLPFYKIEGRNALTVAGELQHIPGQEPGAFNIPEIYQLEENKLKLWPKSELTCFKGLKAKRVIKCLIEVCHGIMNECFIVNMDYRLTFLEFYKTIILCTKLQLKMKAMDEIRGDILAEYKVQLEEYKKQLAEYEKLKENPVVSRKKSRQFPDMSKKGKK